MAELSGLSANDVCIAAAVRTPMGAFGGALAGFSATQLGSIAIKAALERAHITPSDVDELFLGNVCSAGLGQAPASQAALGAGLPASVPCTAVNKVCASGMKAVVLAAQTIITGDNQVVVAGGAESMSNVPHYLPGARRGLRLGGASLLDGLLVDGLTDAAHAMHMGDCAELCAEEHSISRGELDEHALAAHARSRAAAPLAAREIVPVQLPPGRSGGEAGTLCEDEPLARLDEAKLRSMAPHFKQEGGRITAGNSSPLTDGACALVLVSAARAAQLGCPVLAVLRGYGDANQDPRWFTTAPAAAVPKALRRAGLTQADIDYWEVNQAFSVVDLVNQRLLGLDPATVNVHGGSVALGHPLGASGAVLITRLLTVLRARGGRRGVAAICNGGGGASAVVIELLGAPSQL